MVKAIFNDNFPCETSIFISISSNSSISESITPCLAFVFLPYILTIFSILCLLFLIFYSWINLQSKLLQTKLLWLKKCVAIMIVLSCLIQLILLIIVQKPSSLEPILDKIAVCIFSITCLFSYLLCCHNGISSSIWLHLCYFIRLLTIIPEVIVFINTLKINLFILIIFGIEIISIICMVIFLCFVDTNSNGDNNDKKIDPDRKQSSLARILFAQGIHLIINGYRYAINYDTFWSLDSRNDPQKLILEYQKYFNNIKINEEKQYIFPWLLIILLKCKWLQFSASILLSFLFALFIITDPVLLKLIITSIENKYPLWCGLTLVFVTFLVTFTRFILNARSDFYCLLIFTDIQSILVNAIYQKMLKHSSNVKEKYSAGQIVNLLTTDINMIRTLIYTLPEFVSTFVTLICCIVGLSFVIGINALYGLAIFAFFLPINGIGFTLSSFFQREQMQLKDKRLKLVSDVIAGIKTLKFYAWEEPMQILIAKNRMKEMKFQRFMLYCSSLTGIAFNAYPIIATIVSLVGYLIIQGHSLTPQVAFLSLMLFNLMRTPVYRIPNLVQNAINARISFIRIQEFLLESEIPELLNTIQKPSKENIVLEMRNVDFSWAPANHQPILKSLNLEICEGELIGIVGRVGAGKSSLLSSICGELYHISGEFYRKPSYSIAYVPQESWIQNLTLRENILFGKSYDDILYRQVIDSCALKQDIKMLHAGDATEIGERGLNLSGGQKARVALARAVYQNADLYILDDTLSAVDSHVGADIFQNVIGNTGILKNKTRIFALNSIGFFAKCDKIVVMKEGHIVDVGTFNELFSKRNNTFMEMVKELTVKNEQEIKEEKDIRNNQNEAASFCNRNDSDENVISRRRSLSSRLSMSSSNIDNAKLIKEEKLTTGKVSYKMYWYYIKSFGIIFALFYFIFLFVIRTILESFGQVWMARWSSQYGGNNESDVTNLRGLEIYGAFGISSCLVIAISSIFMAYGSYNASTKLYDNLLFSLLRSPMEFFDRTPMGRVLNRLSNDIETIDFAISKKLGYVAKVIADCIFYTLSAMIVMPQLAILIIPVVILAAIVMHFYTITVVQIRRLASKSWSTVLSQATESYIGVTSIRISKSQKIFCDELLRKDTITAESWLAENVANRYGLIIKSPLISDPFSWMMVAMDSITAIFSLALTAGAIYFGYIEIISVGSVGLIASTSTMLRGLLGEITRQMNNLEISLVAVERVQEYVENEHEAEWISSAINIPKVWPTEGNIKFSNFSLRYRSNLPLILKNLNFEIAAGQKIGVVGRTGAGKTSLTLALFRIIEPASGTIFIDNMDYQMVGLHQLRKALTIIPQDPVLFCGKLRINLDPFNEYDDSVLWEAIEKAHLKHFVEKFPDQLNHNISQSGGNLSIGQRQLICLARAILRKQTKILILDEATAAVDVETDQLIQKLVRTHFKGCTILTIAHRLNTIMDYDKVLLMDDGEIREFDSPENLLKNKNSLFYSLASEANLVS